MGDETECWKISLIMVKVNYPVLQWMNLKLLIHDLEGLSTSITERSHGQVVFKGGNKGKMWPNF